MRGCGSGCGVGALHCEHLIEVDIDTYFASHAACSYLVQRDQLAITTSDPQPKLVLTYFLGKDLAEFGFWAPFSLSFLARPIHCPSALLKLIAFASRDSPIFTLLEGSRRHQGPRRPLDHLQKKKPRTGGSGASRVPLGGNL